MTNRYTTRDSLLHERKTHALAVIFVSGSQEKGCKVMEVHNRDRISQSTRKTKPQKTERPNSAALAMDFQEEYKRQRIINTHLQGDIRKLQMELDSLQPSLEHILHCPHSNGNQQQNNSQSAVYNNANTVSMTCPMATQGNTFLPCRFQQMPPNGAGARNPGKMLPPQQGSRCVSAPASIQMTPAQRLPALAPAAGGDVPTTQQPFFTVPCVQVMGASGPHFILGQQHPGFPSVASQAPRATAAPMRATFPYNMGLAACPIAHPRGRAGRKPKHGTCRVVRPKRKSAKSISSKPLADTKRMSCARTVCNSAPASMHSETSAAGIPFTISTAAVSDVSSVRPTARGALSDGHPGTFQNFARQQHLPDLELLAAQCHIREPARNSSPRMSPVGHLKPSTAAHSAVPKSAGHGKVQLAPSASCASEVAPGAGNQAFLETKPRSLGKCTGTLNGVNVSDHQSVSFMTEDGKQKEAMVANSSSETLLDEPNSGPISVPANDLSSVMPAPLTANGTNAMMMSAADDLPPCCWNNVGAALPKLELDSPEGKMDDGGHQQSLVNPQSFNGKSPSPALTPGVTSHATPSPPHDLSPVAMAFNDDDLSQFW